MKKKLLTTFIILFTIIGTFNFAKLVVMNKIREKLGNKGIFATISDSNFYGYGVNLKGIEFNKCGINVNLDSININFLTGSAIIKGGNIKTSRFDEECLNPKDSKISNGESKHTIKIQDINFEAEYKHVQISGKIDNYKEQRLELSDIKLKHEFGEFNSKRAIVLKDGDSKSIEFIDYSVKINKPINSISDSKINTSGQSSNKDLWDLKLSIKLTNGEISINDYGTWKVKEINVGPFGYTILFDENQTIKEPINLSSSKMFGIWSSPDIGEYVINAENIGIKHKILSESEIRIERMHIDISYKKERLIHKDETYRTFWIKFNIKEISGNIMVLIFEDSYNITLEYDKIECQKFLDSVPSELVPILKDVKLSGDMHTRFTAIYDRKNKEKSNFKIEDYLFKCKFINVSENLQTQRYKKIFDHVIYSKSGQRQTVKMGPGTSNWFPLSVMSSFVQRSVTTCEDPYFEVHTPVLPIALENSIKENLRTGKFMRGGSTISMQLAKNLWLDRSKNLSRKLQELFLAYWLEQSMSKEEILELYLNIIEFGPDTYGIKSGTEYYFKSSPANLTFSQALFLASILPNPKALRFGPDGALNPGHLFFLRRIMKSMYENNLISEPEYKRGIEETPIFGKSEISDKDMKLNDEEGTVLQDLEVE